MSENKCPFCGEAMITTEDKIMLCENSDCATMFNEWDYQKVAAAMEFTEKAAWHAECEELKDWMGVGADSRGVYISVFAIESVAADEAETAYRGAVEVWNV